MTILVSFVSIVIGRGEVLNNLGY